MEGVQLEQLELADAGRQLDHDHVADLLLHHRPAQRRRDRDVGRVVEVHRVGDDQLIGFLLLRRLVLDHDLGAEARRIRGNLRKIDRVDLGETLAQVRQAGGNEGLALLGGVIVAVFIQVTERDGLLEGLREGDIQFVVEPLDLFTERLLGCFEHV